MTDEELIRQVAQEVMGWDIYEQYDPPIYVDRHYDAAAMIVAEWNPLLNANHWMMVVERMRDTGHEIIITTPVGPKYLWEVSIDSESVLNESIGHAVCEAAIAAIRSK